MPFAREDLDSNYSQLAVRPLEQGFRADLGQHVIAGGRHFGGEVKPQLRASGDWAVDGLKPGDAIGDLIDRIGSCSTVEDAEAKGGEEGGASRRVSCWPGFVTASKDERPVFESRMLSRPP